jgi:ATP-binding protein involved in chromosome partitioning
MELGGSSHPAYASEPDPVRPRPAQHVVAVASGKGGVGKSTVSLNQALALAEQAKAVGLLDADVYAPDLPVMVNLTRKQHKKGWLIYRNPSVALYPEPSSQKLTGGRSSRLKLEPVERFGLKLMSAAFFLGEDQALSLPASSAYFILSQLAGQADWGELDYLVVDLPPGTADIQQHVISLLEPSGALIVVTPQDLAHLDAKKVIAMFRESNVPVLGAIENMGPLSCPHCHGDVEVFPAVRESRSIWPAGVEKLVELPFDPAIAQFAERNRPLLVSDPQGELAGQFRRLAGAVAGALETE